MIQPKFVGQQNTSPALTSKCAHDSAPLLIDATCVHGMAFGSPYTRRIKKDQKEPLKETVSCIGSGYDLEDLP